MLPIMLIFIRLADPCVPGKPFMQRIAVWTVGLPKKHWARTESSSFDVSAGGNRTAGFQATDHKNTHGAAPSCGRGGVSLMFDEKIKVQWQFGDFVAAPAAPYVYAVCDLIHWG
jgi:hypothetical protein